MALLCFLVVYALKGLHSDFDSYWACLLIAVELPSWAMVWVYRHPRR